MIKRRSIFLSGLLLVDFSFWINIGSSPVQLPSIIDYLIIVFILFTFFQYRIKHPLKLERYGKKFKWITILFIAWSVYLVIESFRAEMFYFQELLKGPYYFLPYFLPIFFLTTSFASEDLLKGLRWGIKLLPALLTIALSVSIALSLNNWYEHYYRLQLFEFWTVPLFLISFLLKKKEKVLVWIYIVFILFLSAYYGRRSWTLDIMLIITAFFLIRFITDKTCLTSLARLMFLSVSLLLILVVFSNQISSLYIFGRGLDIEAIERSRGAVFEDFFGDFNSVGDWMFGRGLNGEVTRHISEDGFGRGIENGYLHTVLKGGNLYFILQWLLFFKVFYLGWFKSNNYLSMSLGALYVIHFLGLVGFNIPAFTFRYIVLWMLVPVLITSDLRRLTNREIIHKLYA